MSVFWSSLLEIELLDKLDDELTSEALLFAIDDGLLEELLDGVLVAADDEVAVTGVELGWVMAVLLPVGLSLSEPPPPQPVRMIASELMSKSE
ncbi:hypothetical protein CBP51_12365 [Cellvibrio mixtus]|uniref:Uncharacterized protein n=1 Tax=Cellvibrio mixtus TaxID=39650 RepID=A0A266QCT5_9GAMM|nr:hypothetical protein [Cellvibrio mixtus]OZY87714.1 hypothetical protein CBP51_12365 [Cellvibrio mixtus]